VTLDYGEEGRAYPVAAGDEWTLGPHRFICASMFELPVPFPGIDVVYADPPWNAAQLTQFHRKAGLKPPEHTWLDIYRRVVELAGDKPCFLEGSRHNAGLVMDLLPGPVVERWPVTYDRGLPAVLQYSGPPLPRDFDPSNLEGDALPRYVLGRYECSVILDPCAGRGLNTRVADAVGSSMVSVELHPNRMSAAMARLARQLGGGAQPERSNRADQEVR
jgi:hypothetical protein